MGEAADSPPVPVASELQAAVHALSGREDLARFVVEPLYEALVGHGMGGTHSGRRLLPGRRASTPPTGITGSGRHSCTKSDGWAVFPAIFVGPGCFTSDPSAPGWAGGRSTLPWRPSTRGLVRPSFACWPKSTPH